MRIFLLSIFLAITGITSAMAGDDPVKQRQALMKENGKAAKLGGQMLKGEIAFDGEAAAKAMQAISGSMDEFIKHFPEGTAKGTESKPEIWDNKADFDALAMKTKEAGANAVKAAKESEDAFKTAFVAVGQSCKGCHEKYRVKK